MSGSKYARYFKWIASEQRSIVKILVRDCEKQLTHLGMKPARSTLRLPDFGKLTQMHFGIITCQTLVQSVIRAGICCGPRSQLTVRIVELRVRSSVL